MSGFDLPKIPKVISESITQTIFMPHFFPIPEGSPAILPYDTYDGASKSTKIQMVINNIYQEIQLTEVGTVKTIEFINKINLRLLGYKEMLLSLTAEENPSFSMYSVLPEKLSWVLEEFEELWTEYQSDFKYLLDGAEPGSKLSPKVKSQLSNIIEGWNHSYNYLIESNRPGWNESNERITC